MSTLSPSGQFNASTVKNLIALHTLYLACVAKKESFIIICITKLHLSESDAGDILAIVTNDDIMSVLLKHTPEKSAELLNLAAIMQGVDKKYMDKSFK